MNRLEIINTELDALNFTSRNYTVAGEFTWSPNFTGKGTNISKASLDECEEITGFLLSKQEKIEQGRAYILLI